MPAILKWTPRIARIIVLAVLVGAVCGASAHPVRSVPLGWLSPALALFASHANASIYLPTISRANGTPVATRRPWRDTTSGIHVFNDQLASGMSEAQWQFSATHYAGTQKMTRDAADRLRAISPHFLILHYRVGLGLGYRPISDGCNPSGDYIRIVEGNAWVQEWNPAALEVWFYHRPEASTTRVLNCDWGWYLMELNNTGWRAYWQSEVLRQLQANDDDGVFLDSLSVPNYLGADRFSPALPALDSTFENAWATRINAWLAWLQTQPVGDYYIVPNVGSWITTRDPTDYSPADGVMIEGFAIEANASPYALEDWQLQMNRALGLVAQGKAVIGQSYALGDQERLFALGTYLLIKGRRTYLNLELDLDPEWWPEYDIPIGAPSQSAGTQITNLYDATNQVYRRNFSNGFVLVNPTSSWDGSGVTRTVNLGGSYYRAVTSGGGAVPTSGVPTGTVTYQAVTSVTLPPYTAVVLFNAHP